MTKKEITQPTPTIQSTELYGVVNLPNGVALETVTIVDGKVVDVQLGAINSMVIILSDLKSAIIDGKYRS